MLEWVPLRRDLERRVEMFLRAGKPSVLLVCGPSGAGKTAMVRAAAHATQTRLCELGPDLDPDELVHAARGFVAATRLRALTQAFLHGRDRDRDRDDCDRIALVVDDAQTFGGAVLKGLCANPHVHSPVVAILSTVHGPEAVRAFRADWASTSCAPRSSATTLSWLLVPRYTADDLQALVMRLGALSLGRARTLAARCHGNGHVALQLTRAILQRGPSGPSGPTAVVDKLLDVAHDFERDVTEEARRRLTLRTSSLFRHLMNDADNDTDDGHAKENQTWTTTTSSSSTRVVQAMVHETMMHRLADDEGVRRRRVHEIHRIRGLVQWCETATDMDRLTGHVHAGPPSSSSSSSRHAIMASTLQIVARAPALQVSQGVSRADLLFVAPRNDHPDRRRSSSSSSSSSSASASDTSTGPLFSDDLEVLHPHAPTVNPRALLLPRSHLVNNDRNGDGQGSPRASMLTLTPSRAMRLDACLFRIVQPRRLVSDEVDTIAEAADDEAPLKRRRR